MVYSQRGPGEAEPAGPEGASHMVDQMTTSIPPCLLRVFPPVIGWAVARGKGQLAHASYSGLATLQHTQ